MAMFALIDHRSLPGEVALSSRVRGLLLFLAVWLLMVAWHGLGFTTMIRIASGDAAWIHAEAESGLLVAGMALVRAGIAFTRAGNFRDWVVLSLVVLTSPGWVAVIYEGVGWFYEHVAA